MIHIIKTSMNHIDIPNESNEEKGQNIKPYVTEQEECIICLDNTLDNMYHFSYFFSCLCM